MHAKYHIWGNKKTIREKCIMCENENSLRETFFFSFLGTKTRKRVNKILYAETEQQQKRQQNGKKYGKFSIWE